MEGLWYDWGKEEDQRLPCNLKEGCHDSNWMQKFSALYVIEMNEGCAVGRGGMMRRFIFIFKLE